MTKAITRDDWELMPMPSQKHPLSYHDAFTHDEARILFQGMRPQSKGDKWFVFYEDGTLYLCRSWKGTVVYWIDLEEREDGFEVVDAWVNRDPTQYRSTDDSYNARYLTHLIRGHILKQPIPLPIPNTIHN